MSEFVVNIQNVDNLRRFEISGNFVYVDVDVSNSHKYNNDYKG